MARNQEKAQSTLYRFRQAQAAELGLTRKEERRPRLASSVSNLRDCEKWRGEVLREISRKVSKIQDFGLSDYEVRDINDEINKLIREKGHWENQIIALGGANYKRGVPKMLDDSGREVPGTRGYKYFGRAKDLPGVKELLNRSVEQEEEVESYKSLKYKRFANQPASYYGDFDEDDGEVLQGEAAAEEEAWKDGMREILEEMQHREGRQGEDDSVIPPIPRPPPKSLKVIREELSATPKDAPKQPKAMAQGSKRKAAASSQKKEKRAKSDGVTEGAEEKEVEEGEERDEEMEASGQDEAPQAAGDSARATAMFSVLDPEEIKMPEVPDRAKTEAFILEARKRALRQQYIGSS